MFSVHPAQLTPGVAILMSQTAAADTSRGARGQRVNFRSIPRSLAEPLAGGLGESCLQEVREAPSSLPLSALVPHVLRPPVSLSEHSKNTEKHRGKVPPLFPAPRIHK